MRNDGREEGCPYNNWKWWPNTLHASRLIMHAQKFRQASLAKDILFRQCYEEGLNISSISVLKETAQELEAAGVTDAVRFLQDSEGMLELQQELQNTSVNGKRISGVPFFSIGGVHTFSGAQDTSNWIRILNQALQNNE